MNGRVTAKLLNVRSYPGMQGRVIGSLPHNALITILDQRNEWFEITHDGKSAFVHSSHVERISATRGMKGKVKPAVLNVRSKPHPLGEIIGALPQNAIQDIVAEAAEWYEIAIDGSPGFIFAEYVELIECTPPARGVISAPLLNVRKQPDMQGEILGRLVQDSVVQISSRIGPWCEIAFGEGVGYIHGDYVKAAGDVEEARFSYQKSSQRQTELEPDSKLPVQGSREERRAATTWDQFGGLLQHLCGEIGIDEGCAVAVLCVESGGEGFNNGRLVIRFENHQFWKWWGRYNPGLFQKHFDYSSDEVWKKHLFRAEERSEWESVHVNQDAEWRVLDFARQLDDTAALKSISMGAPQIMGFNHAKIGYETVQHMFTNFSHDVRFHIMGLFDFFDSNMIQALKRHDFVKFAGYYNGSGQAEAYGGWIGDHYEAFNRIRA